MQPMCAMANKCVLFIIHPYGVNIYYTGVNSMIESWVASLLCCCSRPLIIHLLLSTAAAVAAAVPLGNMWCPACCHGCTWTTTLLSIPPPHLIMTAAN